MQIVRRPAFVEKTTLFLTRNEQRLQTAFVTLVAANLFVITSAAAFLLLLRGR